jgi:DNA-binding MarR family transcriptional regulator
MTNASTATASAHLSEQLCFALTVATKAVAGAYRTRLSPLGLTYPQYLVLLALWERDGRTVGELGEAVRFDSGTLSPLLRRLEQAGHVTRQRMDEDERRVRIALTDTGRALEPRAAQVRLAVEASTGLSAGEFVDLRERLLRLVDAVGHGGA